MLKRVLEFLRCPECKGTLDTAPFETSKGEILTGLVFCPAQHFFPVYDGIPRMLPSSMKEYWGEIKDQVPESVPTAVAAFMAGGQESSVSRDFDTRTKANFSNEWENQEIGGRTWTWDLDARVEWFFLQSIQIPREDLKGKIVLDAGCGNGSQSVAYTEYGLEVVALDLSTGLEKGQAFRDVYSRGNPEKVHFVQADLQNPPLAPDSFDIIHSAGVLHHTADTLATFRTLRPLLKKGGTFYVWLYKYEKIVTPLVNSMRAVTTHIPASLFAGIAQLAAVPFMGFCWTVNKLGIRKYKTPTRKEGALAVHDIFGAPYANYHDYDEVSGWFKSEGFETIWPCNDDRRGFGVCGTLPADA